MTGMRSKYKKTKSGHRYITWDKTNNRWQIHITVNGVVKHTCVRGSLEDAIIKRDKLIDALL